jgi:hypothetical protein
MAMVGERHGNVQQFFTIQQNRASGSRLFYLKVSP